MGVSYDVFSGAFLSKVTEYDFPLLEQDRVKLIDGYMKRAITHFQNVCKYDFSTTRNDVTREFDVDVPAHELDELADIISEGMVVQWMKPYVYRQENLENVLNTKDLSSYSPAELLFRIRETYTGAKREFTNRKREYSYDHGDLTDLHL